jgi:hypothetical protein
MNAVCTECSHLVVDHTSNGCFWAHNCDCKLTYKESLEKYLKALDKERRKG